MNEPNLVRKPNLTDKVIEKQKRLLLIAIFAVITLFISSSYALLTNFDKTDDVISFQTANLHMTLSNTEAINLSGNLPDNDTNGLNNATPITLTFTNTGTMTIGNYDVKLIQDANKTSTLSDEYIKYAISTDGTTYSTPKLLADTNNIIYSGYDLAVDSSSTIYLKIWIAESGGNNALNKEYYGSIGIDLYQKSAIPMVMNPIDAGNGKITFTAIDNGKGLSGYCVNTSETDTTDCTWYTAVAGEQTTESYVTNPGDYYVHLKDTQGTLGHSSVVHVNITYRILEYIQTTGTQYINTEFKPNPATTKAETTLQLTNNTTITQSVFGSRGTASVADKLSTHFFFNVDGSKVLRLDWVGNSTTTASVSINTDITMICENNTVTVNGTKYTSTVTKSTSYTSYPFYIGQLNNAGSTFKNGSYAKFKYFKLYDNGTLVRDYLPVERISDGVIGLYDQVEDKLYVNAGTGTFGKGSVVGAL